MAKAEIPVDYLTQFPLPFVPDPNLPPVPLPGEDYDRTIANFHHPIHNRRTIEGFGPGGESARDARIQWVWYDDHVRSHQEWGGLDEHMPRTATQQYRTTLFGVMGYVPEHAISFTRRTPRVVTLRGAQREMLRTSGQIMIGNDGVRIRRFLLDYTFDKGAPKIDPDLIDQFLRLSARHNANPGRQLALADLLMRQAIEPAVTPGLQEIYSYTKRNSMLKPHLPKALAGLIRREIIFGVPAPQRLIDVVLDKCLAIRRGVPLTA